MFIAATRHKAAFLAEYKADPNAVPTGSLPIALRIGATKPDWRTPDKASLSRDWKDMQVPGQLGVARPRGLRRRGVVHENDRGAAGRRRDDALARPHQQHRRSVGERAVGGPELHPAAGCGAAAAPGGGRGAGGRGAAPAAAAPPAGGRGNLPYELPAGTLKPGANTVTVRITNNRNDGGFLGTPETMFAQAGETRIPLAGAWKYRVERQSNAGALYSKPGELAAHVALANSPAPATGTLPEPAVRAAPDVVIRLSVKSGEMQFDKTELTVAPGQLVEIVFTNPDTMQHNFVLGQPDSLAGDRHRPPTISRGRRTGRRSNTCRRFSRFCSRPSWSSLAKR